MFVIDVFAICSVMFVIDVFCDLVCIMFVFDVYGDRSV